MLIFIENTPRAYAWGSREALPELLGTSPTGEPQAELWLGDHPGAPATVAKGCPEPQTLIELIESDPERYGVDGAHLPFLLKILGIGAPLSLQVHPDRAQAAAGFAREEAAGVPRDAAARNYRDRMHKPELLVALAEVTALCGFRPLAEVRRDLLALAAVAPAGEGQEELLNAAEMCRADDEAGAQFAREKLMRWALTTHREQARAAAEAIAQLRQDVECAVERARMVALRELTAEHPGDPGVVLSLLLHLVCLQPGEAVYLRPRQLHAYLSGIAIEVMAASDNVLRAGLTVKHIAVPELLRIVDFSTLESPRIEAREVAPGLTVWQPPVADFMLMRARVDTRAEGYGGEAERGAAATVRVEAPYPLVLVVVRGRAQVARVGGDLAELASVARGQSLYVSAGDAIAVSGSAEVYLATVGAEWPSVSLPSSAA